MSILDLNRRLFESNFLKSVSSAAADIQNNPDNEAPERAIAQREAPEIHQGRPTEAPDAGIGRMNAHDHDHEFTHGRSQS